MVNIFFGMLICVFFLCLIFRLLFYRMLFMLIPSSKYKTFIRLKISYVIQQKYQARNIMIQRIFIFSSIRYIVYRYWKATCLRRRIWIGLWISISSMRSPSWSLSCFTCNHVRWNEARSNNIVWENADISLASCWSCHKTSKLYKAIEG